VSNGGVSRVDCHVKIVDDRVVDRARRAGLDVIVYAPHFRRLPDIRREAVALSTDDVLVVPAREVFTGTWRNRKHVLAIGLKKPVPDFISLEAAMAEFERQGATVLAPHPEFGPVGLTEADLRRYRETIDGIEIFNPKHFPWHNRRAHDLARELEYPPFTSSYAHLPTSIGVAHTEFDWGIETEADLRRALETDVSRRVVYDSGPNRLATTASELAHLGYENTWKKVDRLFLSGLEPTHPKHIAYDGRFDDAFVY